jgi:hypothetical protein
VQEPAGLGGRLIWRESKTFSLQNETINDGAQVLPTQGRTHRFVRSRIKNQRGGSLVGNTHYVAAATFIQRSLRKFQNCLANSERVKFDFAWLCCRDVQWFLMSERNVAIFINDGSSN